MEERLWHQAVRSENYEPLDDTEAEAVATTATAILSRSGDGSKSLGDHRSAFNAIAYDVMIKGWSNEPPRSLDEIGGLTLDQLQGTLRRAIDSGGRYSRSSRSLLDALKPESTPESDTARDAALDRIRKRLEDRNKESD